MKIKKVLQWARNTIFRRGFGTKRWEKNFGGFGQNSEIGYPAILQETNKIHIGNNTTILNNARLQNFSDKAENVQGIFIGDRCYLGFGLSVLNASKIVIGDDVLMASNVLICSENYGMNPESNLPYMDQKLEAKDVEIGNGCWISQNVCILPGVRIGEKSIIGAGSIVTKSIPDYCIAVGNPARVIKKYNFESHKWEKVDG